jgi:carbon-monoxide dehydrogenase small subunit
MMKEAIKLTVNDKRYEILVSPNKTLLDVLREDLAFTGAKKGCNSGECGTCTVLLDGTPVLACMTLAVEVDGRNILTIEGLARNGEPHPLQRAFVEKGAVQCGFCTPGMILSAVALLDNNPSPSKAEIKRGISGNLCRCTGYVKIIEAIHSVVEQTKGKISSPASTSIPEG